LHDVLESPQPLLRNRIRQFATAILDEVSRDVAAQHLHEHISGELCRFRIIRLRDMGAGALRRRLQAPPKTPRALELDAVCRYSRKRLPRNLERGRAAFRRFLAQEGNPVNTLWARTLAAQLLCLALILVALQALLAPPAGEAGDAQFFGTGQLLARSLAQGCAGAASKPHAAPAGVDALPATPALVWACVAAPTGRVLAHRGTPLLPDPLLRRLRAGAPWAEVPAVRGREACTVFQAPVPRSPPGTVACVALSRDRFRQAAQGRVRGILGGVAAGLVILIGISLAPAKKTLGDVRLLTQAARRMEREAGPQAFPAPASGDLTPLGQALNDMVGALRLRQAQTQRDQVQMRQDEAKYRSLFENAAHGVWQATPELHYLCLNPALASLYGYPSPEALRRHLEDPAAAPVSVSPHRRAEMLRLMREEGGVTGFESQIRRGDGRVIWVSETARAVRDAASGAHYWEGTVEDVTARKHVEADRAHLGNHLRLLLEASGEGIYGIDARGNCTFINAVGAQMLGYEPQEVLARNMHALIHHSLPDRSLYPEERSYLYQSVQTGRRFRVDDEVLWRKGGTPFPAEYTTAPLVEGGRTTGAVVTFVDISARKAVEAEQRRQLAEALERADHDPLTSLLNHRAFHKRLHEEADRAQRSQSTLAVVLLDIDNFKFFNDVYGHKVGDEVLCLVADALRGASRSYDILARFGGDEFAMLMPCGSGETSALLTQHLSERLSGVSYRLPDHDVSIPLGLSLGVAVFPADAPSRMEALELADDRLRRAKTGGDEDGYAERVRSTLTQEREGFSMLDALVTAVDNKDRYTRRHSEDVMRYSAQIARQMGADEATQRLVEVAALIHDVGKIGVPDAVLRKPGALTAGEFAAIQQHPIMGTVIAESVPGFEGTLHAIRHHHERWDGAGYPAGLAGEDIPFLARVMAVADAYSAMTTDRPYRKGMERGKALGILQNGSGVQWDPQCVAAFVRAQEETKSPPVP